MVGRAGNLARTLLATHKIQANAAYLAEGLRWCDSLVALQIPTTTTAGEAAGLWDTGYNEVFIADTGSALVALAVCHELSEDDAKKATYLRRAVSSADESRRRRGRDVDIPSRRVAATPRPRRGYSVGTPVVVSPGRGRRRYVDALSKFSKFVRNGCVDAPDIGSANVSGICPGATPQGQAQGGGWVRADGALGDGWYKDTLNLDPYTIATATTGSCGFVELASAIRATDPDEAAALDGIAQAAAKWIVNNRTSDGRIPYTISPPTPDDHAVYQPISYSAESFIDVDQHYDGALDYLTPLASTCDWLVGNQSADGSWSDFDDSNLLGLTASGDAQRSPRALSLLQWCAARIPDADPSYAASAKKFIDFLLNPENSDHIGVNTLALPTGFVSLSVADYLQPWVTFRAV